MAQTPFEHRLAMAQAGVAGLEGVTVSDCEARREGPSWTVDTLRELAAASPEADGWWLVLGADMAADFPTWRDPDGIRALAEPLVSVRSGGPTIPEGFDCTRLPGEPPEVSATEIRARVAAGEPIEGLVPAGVAGYIAKHGLYR